MTAPKSREGQPNPDTAIVEAALERAAVPSEFRRLIWIDLHILGKSANQIAEVWENDHPAFAQALREGIAARRGQRHGGHGGKG